MTESDKTNLRIRALELALIAPVQADKIVATAKEFFEYITGKTYLDGRDVTVLPNGTFVPTGDSMSPFAVNHEGSNGKST